VEGTFAEVMRLMVPWSFGHSFYEEARDRKKNHGINGNLTFSGRWSGYYALAGYRRCYRDGWMGFATIFSYLLLLDFSSW